MKRAEKRPWKSSELLLLAAPLLIFALWLGWARASKYLAKPPKFGHDNYTLAVAFSPNGKYLLSCGSANNRDGRGEVALWELPSRRLVRRISFPNQVTVVAFARDGERLAFASGAGVQVWDAGLKRRVFDLRTRAGTSQSVEFSADGRLLAAGVWASKGTDGNEIEVWNALTGQRLRRIRNLFHTTPSAHFAREGASIITRSASPSAGLPEVEIQEFDARTGRRLLVWPRPSLAAWGIVIALSPDNSGLAAPFRVGEPDEPTGKSYATPTGDAPDEKGMLLLDARTRAVKWKHATREIPSDTTALAFSPDAKWLASGTSFDGEIEIRNSRTGALARSYKSGPLASLAWSPDSRTLAVAGKLIELHDVSALAQP